jgi:hypothetical protein
MIKLNKMKKMFKFNCNDPLGVVLRVVVLMIVVDLGSFVVVVLLLKVSFIACSIHERKLKRRIEIELEFQRFKP